MSAFSEFISSVVNAEFDFIAIHEFYKSAVTAIALDEHLASIGGAIGSFASTLGAAVPIFLLALSLVELLLGKKVLPVQRFFFCFFIGYCIGVLFVSPLINNIFALPPYVSGAVVGIVMAVLCKYLYFIALAIASGYSVYIICMRGFIPIITIPTAGNYFISLIVAIAAIVLVFIFRKWVEMIGTALLGGAFISEVITDYIYDYEHIALFGDYGWIAELVVVFIIGIVGSIVQIKTRTRY